MTTAMHLLMDLRLRGIEVTAPGDGKVLLRSPAGIDSQTKAQVAANKSALLAALSLETRLHAMAQRWRYTGDDLAEVLVLAAADSAAWTLAVALDERREAEFREAGLLPKVDA